MITTKKLQNNLTFLHKEMKGSNIVDVRIIIKSGQAYDHKLNVPAGTAHFLEHIVHEKTEKYADKEALINIIAQKGGKRNAGTYTNEKMEFFATVLKDEAEHAADYVSQLVAHAILTDEATEKHRAIIKEEYFTQVKNPDTKCRIAFRELAYKGTGLEFMALGDLEGILKITRSDMQKFYDSRYKAEHAVLSIYGDISLESASELAEKYFLDMKTEIPFSPQTSFYPEEYPQITSRMDDVSKKYTHIDIPDKQAVVYFGGLNGGKSAKNYFPLSVLLHILAGDFTSILFKILREEKHLLYGVSGLKSMTDTVGQHGFRLNLGPENIQESLNVINQEVERIADGDIPKNLLVLAKSRIKAHDVFANQTVQSQADDDATMKLFFLNVSDREDYLRKMDAVTKEEVIEAAKYMKDHLNLLAVCSNTKAEYEF